MLMPRNILAHYFYRTRYIFAHISSRISRVEVEAIALVVLALFSPWWGIDRTMPWQKIWGNQVRWADRYSLVRIIDEKQDSKISVMAYGEPIATITPREAGISYDVEALFRTLYADQAPLERIATSLDNVSEVPLVTFDDTLNSSVNALSATVEKPAKDARLDFIDGSARITPEEIGQKVDKEQLKKSLQLAVAQAKASVDMPTQNENPQIVTRDLQSKLEELESIKNRSTLEISVEKDTFSMSAEVLVGLLDMQSLNAPGKLQLSQEKVEEYVKNIIAPQVAKKGVPQTVVILDGAVSQTTVGTDGTILNEESLVKDIMDAFLSGAKKVKGTTVAASAGVVTDKRYSKSATGLRLLLEDWDKETTGEWGVYVKDDTNVSIVGSLHPDQRFVTASIYKLYVAAYVYGELEKGVIANDDMTSLSKTVSECMRVMIVVSDNSCPSYFFDHFGYKNIQQFVNSNGYAMTDLDNSAGGDKYTTAQDTMKLLRDIDSSALISADAEQQLRGYMAQQIYRTGIPKGVSGKTVENKVGFLYGNNHDVGYVRGTQPYTIVIFSNGSSYSAVAELAKRIDTVMSK